VSAWEFNPVMKDGKPIDEWFQIPIHFKLNLMEEIHISHGSSLDSGNKYLDTISNIIRSNMVVPYDLDQTYNPKVKYRIEIEDDGNFKDEPKLIQSSGNLKFDSAVLNAIKRSSPFPTKSTTDKFVPIIVLTYLLDKRECHEQSKVDWEKVFSKEELFVKNISNIKIDPKSLLEKAKRVLKDEETGRKFEIVTNKKMPDGREISIKGKAVIDCLNNEMLIEEEETYSCFFGAGSTIVSDTKKDTYLKKWIKLPKGTRDGQLAEFVCSK
jgi:hypothetical protein